jgi:predicted ATP-dependent serine protease|tara:strand:- start:16912 stop:17832 length:921 start_codon:yes stop_codon:yes gene_type:complete
MNLGFETVKFTKVSDVVIPDTFFNRLETPVEALNAIFGTGILQGSTITLKAKPGVGKTTFALILGEQLTNAGYKVGFTTGEEDVRQLAYNCQRIKVVNLNVSTITDVDVILTMIPTLDFLVIDSFQSLTTVLELNSRARIKYFIDHLVKKAKDHNCALLFIVQENRDGTIKGGTTLPYAVDVNIDITKVKGENDLRIIDNYKNRFGQTICHEGRMTATGLEFVGEYELPEDEKKGKKDSVKVVRKQEILTMDEPPLITVERVMEAFDIKNQSAKLLLSEMETDKTLKKYGRGGEAIWKINEVEVEV